ncbi:MAG: single-stranded DNA-binding protein [Candidatus Omnitrophota bacterium]|nr:MAG: single-stranded DNA-binding protein [Candidatus Omnitrophota bacterium]
MASLNKVLLIGNLTRDPEMRYTPNGTAVTTFSIAISRVFNTNTGEKKEDVSYVRVVCWAKLAQTCSEYLFKGRSVFVEGRLQSRSWQAQDGTKRSSMEVVAQSVQFLGKGRPTEAVSPQVQNDNSAQESFPGIDMDDLSVAQGHTENPPF